MVIAISDDELSSCVGCGLCLPHCPTFRVSGDEALSPRGRIATIRLHHDTGRALDRESADSLNSCIQCRGCEPACPSGVPYGRIIEAAKVELVNRGLSTPRWQRQLLRVLRHPRLLAASTPVLAVARRLRLIPRRLLPSPIPMRPGPSVRSTAVDPDFWLFTGCVMNAWQRSTHRSLAAIADALGATYSVPGRGGGCCGALHIHQGLGDVARSWAGDVMASMPGTAPVVVDSAGCGAALKDYGHLLGTPEAEEFSRRVLDVHEWLAPRMSDLMVGRMTPDPVEVVLVDPCHLRHVQRSHDAVRTVLGHVAHIVETGDDGLCCGAGGAYSALQPDLAESVRARKVTHIERARAGRRIAVAAANPGCLMFLAGAGLDVRHPIDIVARQLEIVP